MDLSVPTFVPKLKTTARSMKQALKPATTGRYLPELLIYIAAWGIVLLFPAVYFLFDVLSGQIEAVHWRGILVLWRDALPFLLLFMLNNRVLLPRLFLRQRVAGYVVAAVASTLLVMAASSLLYSALAGRSGGGECPPQRHTFVRPQARPPQDEAPAAPAQMPKPSAPSAAAPLPAPKPARPAAGEKSRPAPAPPMHGPFIGRVMLALLMLSFNVAVKLFFKSLRDKEALQELERQNLQSELEYLRFQINPHFFMNTLNNIHALVDIDAERAKLTIVELSRLMRYVLYEAGNRTVPLVREVQFLRHYVELMRIRYPDSLRIDLDLPNDDVADVSIPPLLFISFVENAFKHGVSYRAPSFISIRLEVEADGLRFCCANSKHAKADDHHHGIGLENIGKRLQLLFGDRYSLAIRDEEQAFEVTLRVPTRE